MTDTILQAVRLARERICGAVNDGWPIKADDVAVILRELDRLRAERDAAWQAGAEAMREEVAEWVVAYGSRDPLDIAHDIRALPLPGQPKEDAPPFQASTLDALLSVATADEAHAIRACAERLAETEGGA